MYYEILGTRGGTVKEVCEEYRWKGATSLAQPSALFDGSCHGGSALCEALSREVVVESVSCRSCSVVLSRQVLRWCLPTLRTGTDQTCYLTSDSNLFRFLLSIISFFELITSFSLSCLPNHCYCQHTLASIPLLHSSIILPPRLHHGYPRSSLVCW